MVVFLFRLFFRFFEVRVVVGPFPVSKRPGMAPLYVRVGVFRVLWEYVDGGGPVAAGADDDADGSADADGNDGGVSLAGVGDDVDDDVDDDDGDGDFIVTGSDDGVWGLFLIVFSFCFMLYRCFLRFFFPLFSPRFRFFLCFALIIVVL